MTSNSELLEFTYEVCSMGKKNLITLLKLLKDKDNKIKKDLEEELDCYEKYEKKCQKLFKKNNVKPKESSIISDMMSKMGINMNVMNDNSDSKIAEIIIQGTDMGIIEMEKKIKEYEDLTDKDIVKLAKEVLKFQEKSVKDIKEYL